MLIKALAVIGVLLIILLIGATWWGARDIAKSK